MEIERLWAPRPSALASSIAAGANARNCSMPSFSTDVRLTKSNTERPEEKREATQAIIKELAAGGDFAKIAGKESKDAGSGKKGGDLGWFTAQSMVKPFSDAVAAMQKGQTTPQPVQSEFGWHVINLEDIRSPSAPAYDDVKQQVEMLAQRKKLQAYLDELRKTAKIQITK